MLYDFTIRFPVGKELSLAAAQALTLAANQAVGATERDSNQERSQLAGGLVLAVEYTFKDAAACKVAENKYRANTLAKKYPKAIIRYGESDQLEESSYRIGRQLMRLGATSREAASLAVRITARRK